MRHLHFTQSLEPLQGGGLGTSTVALHRQLLTAGIASRLCSTFRGAPQEPAQHTLEFRRAGPDFLYFAPRLNQFANTLVAETDVVHGHGLYVGTNYALGHAARRQGKPLVYHVHGMFEPYILNRSRWKKRLVHWLFEDANFRHVSLWRALTQKEADQIRSCGIRTPIVVIPNGIRLEDFTNTAKSICGTNMPSAIRDKRKARALFMGRLHPKKGLDLLLAAWARLGFVKKDWELIVAGPDEGGYLAELQRLAGSLAIESEVTFTGSVSGTARNELLHTADMFILPSYSEGFSMSLLEAMACEVPVIATRACNFPDIIKAQAGWECEPELMSLTAAMQTAVSAGSLERQQRGRNGRWLVERFYTWPQIIHRLLEACASLC